MLGLVFGFVGAITVVVVLVIGVLVMSGRLGVEIEHQPARRCRVCGLWFNPPNEREQMCFYCIKEDWKTD